MSCVMERKLHRLGKSLLAFNGEDGGKMKEELSWGERRPWGIDSIVGKWRIDQQEVRVRGRNMLES